MTKELNEILEELKSIETRSAEMEPLAETAEDAEIEAREKEVGEMETRRSELVKRKEEIEAEERAAKEAAKHENKAEEVEIPKEERGKKMDIMEIRSSHEYNMAYAEYVKTNDDKECRSILTDLVSGTVPTPTMVQDAIETAWANTQIFSRVRKTNVPGTLKVPYEASATGAVAHTEGAAAPDEEVLTLGTIELTPVMLKKWITFSDEVNALKGEAFLSYLNAELVQRIAELADNTIVAKIKASALKATYTAGTKSYQTILNGLAALSDQATNPVVIWTKAAYFAAMAEAGTDNHPIFNIIAENGKPNYTIDGIPVLFNANATDAIIGDLDGVLANLPEGDGVKFISDPYSLAEKDLVKVVARMYVGVDVVKPNYFAVKGE